LRDARAASQFPGAYIDLLVESSLDSLLQYGICGLAWAVLRPFHALPPRRVLAVSALGVLLRVRWRAVFFGTRTVAAHWDLC